MHENVDKVNLFPLNLNVSISSPRETSLFWENKTCSFPRIQTLYFKYWLNNLQCFKATETTKGVTVDIFDCVAMEKPTNNDADDVTA